MGREGEHAYTACGDGWVWPELAIENAEDKARRVLAYLQKNEANKVQPRQNKMDPNDPLDRKLAMGEGAEPTCLMVWFSKTGLSAPISSSACS